MLQEKQQQSDFCIAWNWEYDADFVSLLESSCRNRSITLFQITPDNIDNVLQSIEHNSPCWQIFFDRASDTDRRFHPIVEWARKNVRFYINHIDCALRAGNKALMHLPFITAGIYTPYTIILPPYDEQPNIPQKDLTPLGEKFIIKPARGGGGEGVVTDATSWNRVITTREKHPSDMYLLQAFIEPINLCGKPAWFRVLYCAETVYPHWWDTHTHIYSPVTEEEEHKFNITELRTITHTIAEICRLELFSTEIALTGDSTFVVVDYINDQIDLRLQSKAVDGIPDDVVCSIAERLTEIGIQKTQKLPDGIHNIQ